MFRVVFTYDETARKWLPSIEGAKDSTEALQGFTAVVLTCQQLDEKILDKSLAIAVFDHFNIVPAV